MSDMIPVVKPKTKIMELTNALRKTVQSLAQRRHRKATGLFKAEGTKCVCDTVDAFTTEWLIATGEWLAAHGEMGVDTERVVVASRRDLERMSEMQCPPDVIAVYRQPDSFPVQVDTDGLVLALDCVQDPGNLGTIIRTADWFGIDSILASMDTADCFGPKVIQATMGAISRVRVEYCDLVQRLGELRNNGVKVYATVLGGESVYDAVEFGTGKSVLVMGNEGRGISSDVVSISTDFLTIPAFPEGRPTSESLNVGTATAVVVSEFRRRQKEQTSYNHQLQNI